MLKRIETLVLGILITVTGFGQIPAGYYNTATGLHSAQLKTALHKIIRGHTKYNYDHLWTSFYTTDDKPNGTVWDMYSDIPDATPNGSPPYVYTFGVAGNQCATTPGYENSCYNREHSFPKSWFSGVESDTMYTDKFHLYPADSYVNSRRNNYPYGQVTNPTWTSLNGSKLGPCSYPGYTGIVFEPRNDFKGDLARTYFYMATRYESRIASWADDDPYGNAIMNATSFPCFEPWFLNMLLAWNAADPVSQKEIDRNNDIYANYQHNRNPFIDHPEYVTEIWAYAPSALPEPTNSPTNFSSNSIHLQWQDATGGVLPDGYLIRMSNVSYADIQAPVDGVAITNSPIDKNVLYGIKEAWFTNLTPGTTYYFKLYPFTGTGPDINYKIDGVIPQSAQSTTP